MLKFILMIVPTLIMNNKNNKSMMMMFIMLMMFNLSLQEKIIGKLSYMIMGDLISFWISNMSAWIIFIMMFINMKKITMYKKVMSFLLMILILTFYNWNFMMFYVLFEMSVVTILIIIISWSYQPERMEAMMFMVIMTFMFSLPFMMSMMIEYKYLNFWFINKKINLINYMSFLFIFMVKIPMYFMHIWLPKVHVEAPVHGSMILAAIMLKLGCYGMIRMNNMMSNFMNLNKIIFTMSLWSMIILSMNCMMQIDIKTLIAYSSVVHMTMTIMNILMNKNKSIFSSMLIMLGHGLCSATMFFITSIMYKNSKSRSILLNKSMMMNSPTMSTIWFLSCMNNAPMPPSINLLGEMLSIKNIFNWSMTLLTPTFIMMFLSSMYSIYLFYLPKQGKPSLNINKPELNKSANMVICMILILPIILISIKPMMLFI
uniref:NADH-ubiquinone oxidoreductase chain 4 n=1 Tax=Aleyrodes shizuokensis TaxID=860392 RepID=A0A7T1K7L0_9HEMI|nr:NADH dehydrogenase subunit 4 [Aleyrodes shizuokensis]QPO06179.1 NADH dehydrogenase subunit 4 [Aleyrodes shizuokensis]